MAETIIIKGALEDHLGRTIHPDTEADQVMTQNGKTVEERMADLLANFANYLPLTGGRLTGKLEIGGKIFTIPNWGCISSSDDGSVVIGLNAYKDPIKKTFHYMTNHDSMGAKGIMFRFGLAGIWYFDTGNIPTVKDAEFTPTLISLTDKSTKQFTGDLNNIRENTLVDGTSMANAPGTDWYYVQHIAHSKDASYYATQIAYAFLSTDVYRRRMVQGVWSAWEPFLTPSNTPTQHYSTAAPSASDGKNGDVWDVIV